MDCGINHWLIGDSPQMAKVAEDILIVGPDDITVLITGEPRI
jgi:transcriptional regulator with GAF, ATPase, and Fis domain